MAINGCIMHSRTISSNLSATFQEINSFGWYNDTVKNSSITTKRLYLILTFRARTYQLHDIADVLTVMSHDLFKQSTAGKASAPIIIVSYIPVQHLVSSVQCHSPNSKSNKIFRQILPQ